MGEIKNKLNISKITIKNLFLVILLMVVMAIVGIVAKSIGSKVVNINTAQAQSCWTPSGGGGSEGGEGSEGSGGSTGGEGIACGGGTCESEPA